MLNFDYYLILSVPECQIYGYKYLASKITKDIDKL
jgi:hypothetical protein